MINKLGKKVLCVCRDEGQAYGFAGTIHLDLYTLPGGLPAPCEMPKFSDTGSLGSVFWCLAYDVVN